MLEGLSEEVPEETNIGSEVGYSQSDRNGEGGDDSGLSVMMAVDCV